MNRKSNSSGPQNTSRTRRMFLKFCVPLCPPPKSHGGKQQQPPPGVVEPGQDKEDSEMAAVAAAVAAAQTESGDENEARGNWTGRFDFLLSCVGYAVGLGNVWRFPYLCYQNGGGAFLIPYFIMLALAALPLFYLELAFGQFANLGPITIWKACPILRGTGWAMVTISGLISIYYNVIIAWSLFYLFASFTAKLPWSDCKNEWNDHLCRDRALPNSPAQNETEYSNDTSLTTAAPSCGTNGTEKSEDCPKFQTPSEQYFERVMLGYTSFGGVTKTMNEPIGAPQWHVSLCLLLAWILIFLCLVKGVKSSGKVVYVTATFPYLVLTILFIRGITLDGARDGILFYVWPNFERLADSKVWSEAAVQIFFSLSLSFGGLITMSSFNKFHNNCYRDALLVSAINCSTSIFAGFAIFSVVGFMAKKTGLPVSEVVSQGPGLAFVAYPEGLAAMPLAPLWSILFFIMILTLGVDSQFAIVETVLTAFIDEFQLLQSNFKLQTIFKLVVCLILFLLGLPLCCKGGIHLFELLNGYSAYYNLLFVALVELIGISYLYGIKNFMGDIEMMLGYKPGYYWVACWAVVSPLIILSIMIFALVQYKPSGYGGTMLPAWGEALAWLMMLGTILLIPAFAIYEVLKNGCSRQGLINATTETMSWGPPVKAYWASSAKYFKKLTESEQANEVQATVKDIQEVEIPPEEADEQGEIIWQ